MLHILLEKNVFLIKIIIFRVCLVQPRGGEERDFNEGEEDLLIIYMLGSKNERGGKRRDFKF
jgi:hypothetical protein